MASNLDPTSDEWRVYGGYCARDVGINIVGQVKEGVVTMDLDIQVQWLNLTPEVAEYVAERLMYIAQELRNAR